MLQGVPADRRCPRLNAGPVRRRCCPRPTARGFRPPCPALDSHMPTTRYLSRGDWVSTGPAIGAHGLISEFRLYVPAAFCGFRSNESLKVSVFAGLRGNANWTDNLAYVMRWPTDVDTGRGSTTTHWRCPPIHRNDQRRRDFRPQGPLQKALGDVPLLYSAADLAPGRGLSAGRQRPLENFWPSCAVGVKDFIRGVSPLPIAGLSAEPPLQS